MHPALLVLARRTKAFLFVILAIFRRFAGLFRRASSEASISANQAQTPFDSDSTFDLVIQDGGGPISTSIPAFDHRSNRADNSVQSTCDSSSLAQPLAWVSTGTDLWTDDELRLLSTQQQQPSNNTFPERGGSVTKSSYSNFSLINQQQQSPFSSNNIGSQISVGPNRTVYHQSHSTKISGPGPDSDSAAACDEPDFFQDMTPALTKPKTIYVADADLQSSRRSPPLPFAPSHMFAPIDSNDNHLISAPNSTMHQDASSIRNSKFSIGTNFAPILHDADFDSRFGHFGSMEKLPKSSPLELPDSVNAGGDSWDGIDDAWKELDAHRREQRAQRLREHQARQQMKQAARANRSNATGLLPTETRPPRPTN